MDERASDKESGISGILLKQRTILLSGEINKDLAKSINGTLLALDSQNSEPIVIYIDSPGGDVHAGFAVFDMIRLMRSPIYTIGIGLIASAGALILLGAERSRRLGTPHSNYMIHQPLSGMSGVATDIEIHARETERLRNKINDIIAAECSKDIKKVEQDTDRDYWLTAAMAQRYGLIKSVVASAADVARVVKGKKPSGADGKKAAGTGGKKSIGAGGTSGASGKTE